MRRIVSVFAVLLAVVVLSGCEDTVTDPATDKLIGTWTASKLGATFAGSSTLDLEFKASGDVVVTQSSDVDGSYTTSSSSADPDIRNITITYGTVSLVGVYKISGSSMELELVPSTASTKPSPELGVGSTGQANVSILVKQ